MDKIVTVSGGDTGFWENSESLCLLNPGLPLKKRRLIEKAVDQYKGENQIWLKSSGTELSGYGMRILCLSKQGILRAAESVNQFYKITSRDLWLNPLPLFHVGGLSVGARCFLAKALEFRVSSWKALHFYKVLQETKASLTSLVPTQVFDLVEAGLECPPDLRLVLVGGGALSQELYKKARHFQWPLAPVYGMTETGALIAGASLASLQSENFPEMELLPHVKLRIQGNNSVIESPSLFDSYLRVSHDSAPVFEKRPIPFVLDDRLKINGCYLRVLARSTEMVKVLGETVNLVELSHKIGKKIKQKCIVIGQPHPRLGSRLCLFVESQNKQWNLEQINESLMAFEQVKVIHSVASFPRSVMGKILKPRLLESMKCYK